MVKVRCKYCGRKKHIPPSTVKDVSDYHCRSCMPIHNLILGKQGKLSVHDWSQQRKISSLALQLRRIEK